MNPVIEYSPEELAILREIFSSPDTIESQVHLLPRRTPDSIKAKARALGLVKVRGNNILSRIHALMADGNARTVRQIEKAIGGRRKYIAEQMRLAANGIDYHVDSYAGAFRCYVFKLGPGKNAVRPPPAHTPGKVYSQRMRERRREDRQPKKVATQKAKRERAVADSSAERLKDDKYRLPATRWPQSDAAVFDAISAMARVGRQAA